MKKDPANGTLCMYIADSYTADKQYKKARSWLRKALRKSGDNAMLLKKLANVYYLSGDIEKALKIDPLLTSSTFSTSHDTGTRFSVKGEYSPKTPNQSEFAKFFGWGSRPAPGSLTVDTSCAHLKLSQSEGVRQCVALSETTGIESVPSVNDVMTTPTMIRKPRVKPIRSGGSETTFEMAGDMSSSFCTPSTDGTSMGCCNISIRAKRQQVPQITEITDEYSQRQITAGTWVAALEGYFPQHFDQMIVQYGDLVLVKEIYEDGWAVGIKLKRKVWEEVNTIIDEQKEDLTTNWADLRGVEGGDMHSVSDMYLVELLHFCHSEAWEEVINLSEHY